MHSKYTNKKKRCRQSWNIPGRATGVVKDGATGGGGTPSRSGTGGAATAATEQKAPPNEKKKIQNTEQNTSVTSTEHNAAPRKVKASTLRVNQSETSARKVPQYSPYTEKRRRFLEAAKKHSMARQRTAYLRASPRVFLSASASPSPCPSAWAGPSSSPCPSAQLCPSAAPGLAPSPCPSPPASLKKGKKQ